MAGIPKEAKTTPTFRSKLEIRGIRPSAIAKAVVLDSLALVASEQAYRPQPSAKRSGQIVALRWLAEWPPGWCSVGGLLDRPKLSSWLGRHIRGNTRTPWSSSG